MLRRALDSLVACDKPPAHVSWEAVVIDNGSLDDTASTVASFRGRLPIRAIREDDPGLSNARNRAVREAHGDWVLFIDDDVTVGKRWLIAYAEAIALHADACAFGGPIEIDFEESPPPWLSSGIRWILDAYAGRSDTDFHGSFGARGPKPYGANFALRRAVAHDFPFDPMLGHHPLRPTMGGEETVVIAAMLTNQGEGWWVPDAGVTHHIDSSRQSIGYLRSYYVDAGYLSARNRMSASLRASMAKLSVAWRGPPSTNCAISRCARSVNGTIACVGYAMPRGTGAMPKDTRAAWATCSILGNGAARHESKIARDRARRLRGEHRRADDARGSAAGACRVVRAQRPASSRPRGRQAHWARVGTFQHRALAEAANRWSAVEFDPATYRCKQVGTAQCPFPNALAAKTVVFDPPYFDLDRAPDVDGIVSWGAHDPGTPQRANPSRLLSEIRDRFGDYPATRWIYGFTWPDVLRTREMGAALVGAVHVRADIARWLLTQRLPDWSLGIVVASELHSASEALWHGVDERHPLHRLPSATEARAGLEGTYEAIDGLVATLRSSCPDAAVLAFSMHGMGPNESDVASMVLLPELMYRAHFKRAFLHGAGDALGRSVVPMAIEDAAWSDQLRRHFPSRALESGTPSGDFTRRLRRRIPDPAKRLLKRALRRSPKAMASSLGWMPADWYCDFWREMDAFALPSFYDGQIRINLKGRETHGRVALEAYRSTCDRIEDDLRACLDPTTGRSVVREVVRTHRSCPLDLGPTEADLVVVWEGSASAFEHPSYGTIGPCPFRRPGGHTGDHGVALFCDADTKPGFYGTRSAFDVVPTIIEYVTGSVAPRLSGESFLGRIAEGAEGAAV